MSGNYSCFNAPVDLSLTGSQVSPTRKSKPSSARSSLSHKSGSFTKHSKSNGKPKNSANSLRLKPSSSTKTGMQSSSSKEKSLAMTFPSKKSKHPHHNSTPENITDDYIDSFFFKSHVKSKSHSQSTSSYSKRKYAYEERVFKVPDSARSDSVYSNEKFSPRNSLLDVDLKSSNSPFLDSNSLVGDGDGDADVDYLKSYISIMDKYKDTPSNDENEVQDLTVGEFDSSRQESSNLLDFPTSTPLVVNLSRFDPLQDDSVVAFRKKRSARVIQLWYRRHATRKKRNEAIMKKMLAQKKEDVQNNLVRESLRSSMRTDDERKKHRQQREKEARKKAIQELQEKRNAEKEKMRKIAEEEVEVVRKKVEAEKKKLSQSRTSSKASVYSATEKSTKQDALHTVSAASQPNDDDEVETRDSRLTETVSNQEKDGSKLGDGFSHSNVTLNDVLETIKRLEEEPNQLSKPKSALDEKLSWIDDLQEELQSNISKTSQKPVTQSDPSAIVAKAKLQSISSFLDEIEKEKDCTSLVHHDEEDALKHLKEAEQGASEVTSQMLNLKFTLEEKTRSVKLLQDALTQQRELNLRQCQEQEKDYSHRLKMQKDQYETAIKRHLSFIDQLIDDKKVLNEKCEKLLQEMKQAEGKYQKKIKNLSGSHQAELQKSKDVFAAAEKIRREKWIDEKTKKIKEMTVKGLEPEIQRLIAKHKEEMKKVKAIHDAELLRSDERAGQRYIRQTEELREQLEREKEAACTREREMARQRYEKQMEQEEIALQQQRKRLYSEVAEEKERLNQQVVRQRKELDELKEQLEANNRIASSTLRDEFEKSAEDMQRRHKDELKALQDRFEIEKQAWQENYMKKQESFMMQKERELKEAVRRDRDSEIDAAISRLESDMHQQREEIDKTTENRIKRIRDKYEAEMREVERSEKQTHEKYNSMKADFDEIESENLRLQSLCKQKEQEVADMLKIKNKLVEERGNVSEVIRQEFADRLVVTDEENKRMKNELSELRARQRLELERINNEKEEELAEVHKRVRQAIIKKEEIISDIKNQYEAAVKRSEHLESLLEQQRKKLLGKKK